MTRSIVTSFDGEWAAMRRDREVALFAGGAPPAVGQLTLDGDDVDLVMVGPPSTLVALSRTQRTLTSYQPPYLEAAARLDLDETYRIAATTGPRLALVSSDGKSVLVVRASGRALTAQPIDVGSPVEFVVGLEKHQLLFGLLRKLEVWDAVSCRPLLRLQLQLPPPPRIVGAALGHLWVSSPTSDEVFIYRLSDGRPFRHHVGSPIERIICHPASPVIVMVTARGLVRLHCFAHALSVIAIPEEAAAGSLALLTTGGEDVSLIGMAGDETWRVPVGAAPAADIAPEPVATKPRERAEVAVEVRPPAATSSVAPRADWREALAVYGAELARGEAAEVPMIAVDTELGAVAHRLGLPAPARRALIALYALHLNGEPAPSIARLARALGDWTEALGKGELGALAMLRKKHGTVALRGVVTDLLDGCPPRTVRLIGDGPPAPRAGAFRVARDGRSDVEIEAALAAQLGRIAVAAGPIDTALLEARLRSVTCVVTTLLTERPTRWPHGAGLVLVLYGSPSSWVADLPTL